MLGLVCLIVAVSIFVMPWVVVLAALVAEAKDRG